MKDVYTRCSEVAKRCRDFEKTVDKESFKLLTISELSWPVWSQGEFEDLYGSECLAQAKVYKCSRPEINAAFYIFAAPQGKGYAGFMIGHKHEVYVSTKNFKVEPAEETFIVKIEGHPVRMACKLTTAPDAFQILDGEYPEILAMAIAGFDKNAQQYTVEFKEGKRYWDEIEKEVEELEKYLR